MEGLIQYYGPSKVEVIKVVYSSDNKYVMNLVEYDLGATGGETDIYVGRNLDFGVLVL